MMLNLARARARLSQEALARARTRLSEDALTASPLRAVLTEAGQVVLEHDIDLYEIEEEVSSSMNMLATVLISRAHYSEARRIMEQLVARDTGRWGADDEVTLGSRVGLLQALVDMGDFAAARQMSDQLVATCIERIGPRNDTTLDAQAVRAQVLAYVGEEAQARDLWDEIVAARIAESGPMHKDTICAKHMQADMLHSSGDAAAATALFKEVLAAYTQQLGPTHEDTLNAEGCLAEVQIALGRDLPAAELTLKRYVLCWSIPCVLQSCLLNATLVCPGLSTVWSSSVGIMTAGCWLCVAL